MVYHIQAEGSRREGLTFFYVDETEERFTTGRHEGDITFCAQCEEYFFVSFGDTLCFKCRGHEEIK